MNFKSLVQLFLGAQFFIFPMTFNAEASCAGLSLEDTGGGGYKIVARGLINVSGIDLTLTYDKASLTNPNVSKGGMADWLIFFPSIVEASGTVRVAMVTEPSVSGSGTVATVTFSPVGKSWVKPALTCTLTGLDASNQPIIGTLSSATEQQIQPDSGQAVEPTQPAEPAQPVQPAQKPVSSTNQPVQATQQPAQAGADSTQQGNQGKQNLSQGMTVSTTTLAAPGTIVSSTVSPFQEQQPSEQSQPREQAPAEPNLGEQPAQWQPSAVVSDREVEEHEPSEMAYPPPSVPAPPVAAPVQDQKYLVYGGVLQRFKDYKGERTPKSFEALFSQPVATMIKQDPLICISDGTMTLKVLIELPERGIQAPNFALRGASLKSLKKHGDNSWIIEAVPDVGRVEATLTIINGEKVTEYPFTVAPRVNVDIDKNGVTDEVDFTRFLSATGSEKAPTYDFDGDGKRDYVDDYIYTANYLAAAADNRSEKK